MTSVPKADNLYIYIKFLNQMLVIILILAAIILAGLGFGLTIWFALRNRLPDDARRPTAETNQSGSLRFRLSYVIGPVIILVLSIIVTAIFYPKLSADVGYHFNAEGAPDRWFSRGMAMVLMLAPQILLTLLSVSIIRVIQRLNILTDQSNILGGKPQRMLALMGNVAVLPQLIVALAMLDIFNYNANQVHLFSTTTLLIILGVITAALVVVLIYFVSKSRKKSIYQPEE